MEPSYYAIIPAFVRYDERLKSAAKLLYGEITCLAQRDGYCWAENVYFATLYKVDVKTISRWISQLNEYGYIEVELLKMEGNKRKITIDKKVTTYPQKNHEVVTKKSLGSDKKVTSIYENIIINNKKNKEDTALVFFKNNYPSDWEVFLMKYKSKIKDFQKFEGRLELKLEAEDIPYKFRPINARIQSFALNYIEMDEKVIQLQPEAQPVAKQTYQKTRF